MKNTNKSTTRREFIKRSSLGATAFLFVSPSVLGRDGASPSDKLNIAAAGVGSRGGHDLRQCLSQNIVALCDVDEKYAAKTYGQFEKVPKYIDFRVMLDKQKDIDALIVGTPDHTHAVIAVNAMQRGKHVFVEKPLARDINEVRTLMKAAKKYNVQTQLGNQGHSTNDIRDVCELIQSGAVGGVRKVHLWYERPYGQGKGRPTDTPPVPKTLDWDLWLGPAPERPYHPDYAPRVWRYWFDFGTGVMGDWVCHIFDPSFWALKLGSPESITARNGGPYDFEQFATSSDVIYKFPAREGMPPVEITWSYGKKLDRLNLSQLEGVKLSDWNRQAGGLIVGEKASIVHIAHGAGDYQVLPNTKGQEIKAPEKTIPRVKNQDHYEDWIRACKDGKPASSNFTYGGPLTEIALLGVIATRFDGEELKWDGKQCKFTNNDKANNFIQREYRKGWTL